MGSLDGAHEGGVCSLALRGTLLASRQEGGDRTIYMFINLEMLTVQVKLITHKHNSDDDDRYRQVF